MTVGRQRDLPLNFHSFQHSVLVVEGDLVPSSLVMYHSVSGLLAPKVDQLICIGYTDTHNMLMQTVVYSIQLGMRGGMGKGV